MLARAVDVSNDDAAVSVCRAATVFIPNAVGVAEKADVTTVDTVTVPFGVEEGASVALI
jgi:hypothetical protein